jgi:Protease II
MEPSQVPPRQALRNQATASTRAADDRRLRSADDLASERIVVDPAALDPSGSTAIDFYEPSADGSRVAVSLSVGGNERGDVYIFDVATGRQLPDVVPRVNGGTAGGSLRGTPTAADSSIRGIRGLANDPTWSSISFNSSTSTRSAGVTRTRTK